MAEEFYSIGKGEIRQDALLKVTGQAEYTTDIHPRGMVYGKILGSPIPHGIIKSIDTSEAEKLPGVVCVVTGEDGPDHPTIGGYLTDRYIMNRVGQKVRYVGDFVAAVAATDEQIAEAACKLIKVEYEPLPYVLDVEEAFREDCPAVVHEDVQSYKRLDLHGVAHCMDKKHPNQAIRRKVRHSESFDLDPDSFETPEAYDEAFEKKFNEEFDKAYLKLPTQRYEFPRVSHCFMEPHVSVVVPLVDGGIELWSSEQGGRLIKNSMSSAFGLKPSDFHVHVPFMGGGFGGKDDSPCTGPAIMLALKCKRPVKIVQTREEVFSNGQPRPSAVIYVTDGYNKDGTLAATSHARYMKQPLQGLCELRRLHHLRAGHARPQRLRPLRQLPQPEPPRRRLRHLHQHPVQRALPRPGLRALCLRRRAQPRHGRRAAGHRQV